MIISRGRRATHWGARGTIPPSPIARIAIVTLVVILVVAMVEVMVVILVIVPLHWWGTWNLLGAVLGLAGSGGGRGS